MADMVNVCSKRCYNFPGECGGTVRSLVSSGISSLSLSDHRHRRIMNTRLLGNSDLAITPIGIGAWAIGGGGWNGSMGPQNDADSIPAIHAALDHGLNWIDTAALYGLGHSEKMVARAIQGRSPRPYVFTKCERVWDTNRNIGACLKAESVRRECEDSLRRLRVDAIDLYQIHWPEPDPDIEEGWTELARLKEEGKLAPSILPRYLDQVRASGSDRGRLRRLSNGGGCLRIPGGLIPLSGTLRCCGSCPKRARI